MASLDLSKTYVIITAGGVGKRMGGKTAKQFIELEGKPVLLRTIEMFRGLSPDINIILTLPRSTRSIGGTIALRTGSGSDTPLFPEE